MFSVITNFNKLDRNEFIYYVRLNTSKSKAIVGTVCVKLLPDGKVCRGIAIVSSDDNGSKAQGRSLAIGRARKAARKRYSNSVMNVQDGHQAVQIFQACWDGDSTFKSEYNAIPTDFETRILQNAV
jgi:hypothetical protein